MLTNTSRWSHARGNEVVPSRWQATAPEPGGGNTAAAISHNNPEATITGPSANNFRII